MLGRMILVACVLALLAAALHVAIFVLESVLFRRPGVHARFATRPDDVAAVAPWAYNQGFYNLFLAVGAGVGAVLALGGGGSSTVGLALVLLACGSMLAAALVLGLSDRRMLPAAAAQGTVPLLAVVAAVVALA